MGIWRWEEYTVAGLARQRDRGTLNLHPLYQRTLVHNDVWKRQLIADMVQGQKTIPSIVLREYPNKSLEAADGQQRLDAIYAYTKAAPMQGLPTPSPKGAKRHKVVDDPFAWARTRHEDVPEFVPYVDLTPQQQDTFDSYKLIAEVVTEISDDEIRVEFIKRNTSQSPVSGGEKIFASSKQPGTALAISTIGSHSAFTRCPQKRYRHLLGVCLVLFIALDESNADVSRWDNEGLEFLAKLDGGVAEKAANSIKSVLDEVEKVLEQLEKQQEKAGPVRKVYNPAGLRVLIPQLTLALRNKGMFITNGHRRYAKLVFERLCASVPGDVQFKIFDHGLDLKSPEAAKNVAIFEAAATPDLFRDTKRLFSEIDVRELLARDGDACKQCDKVEQLFGDHVVPWSDGGRTDVANGQLLCYDCHQRKTTTDQSKKPAAQ